MTSDTNPWPSVTSSGVPRRAFAKGAWSAPVVVLAANAPASAASVGDATFSFTDTSLIWEMPKASSDFFLARYTLVNDGDGPGKPVVTFYAATERISLVIDQLDPNWVASPGPTAYSKTLTWVGPDIDPGETVILGGTNTAVPGYFRGTVGNTPPDLGTAREASNFNTAASVEPAGANPSVFYDGDNYP